VWLKLKTESGKQGLLWLFAASAAEAQAHEVRLKVEAES
jgi:hypothetical protein